MESLPQVFFIDEDLKQKDRKAFSQSHVLEEVIKLARCVQGATMAWVHFAGRPTTDANFEVRV